MEIVFSLLYFWQSNRMTNQQKLAVKLFRPKKIRKVMEDKGNINFRVALVGEVGTIGIIFDDGFVGEDVFSVVVDEEWFLCSDYKLRRDENLAELFTKGKYKDIRERAMMAVAATLAGKFKKEVEYRNG